MKLPENTVLRWCIYGAVLGCIMAVLFVLGIMEPKPYPWEGEGLIANVSRIGGMIIGGAFWLGLIGLLIAGSRRVFKR